MHFVRTHTYIAGQWCQSQSRAGAFNTLAILTAATLRRRCQSVATCNTAYSGLCGILNDALKWNIKQAHTHRCLTAIFHANLAFISYIADKGTSRCCTSSSLQSRILNTDHLSTHICMCINLVTIGSGSYSITNAQVGASHLQPNQQTQRNSFVTRELGLLKHFTSVLSSRTSLINAHIPVPLLTVSQRDFNTLSGNGPKIRRQKKSLIQLAVPCRTRSSKAGSLSFRLDIQKIMESGDDWIIAGDHRIHAWSISGIESCIVTQLEGINLAFDMGYATRPSIKCDHVFISHGHIDHVVSVLKHAAVRSLFSLKPATYYCPPHLEEPFRALAASISQLHGGNENFSDLQLTPLSPGDSIQITKRLCVLAFPTVHRVPSQGYLVYRTRNVLKAEYADLPGTEVGELVRAGVQVREAVTSPELAYTGDTTFEVFTSPPLQDLLRVKTLITEATYLDDEEDRKGHRGVQRARARGHLHIQELIDNEQLFDQVSHILLVHFSDKYSVRYIRRKTEELLTEGLKQKVLLGITMKQTLG